MPETEPILVYNRYSGRVEREPVYGETWLRWTYHSKPGRAILHFLVKHAWFSRFYGWRMRRPWSARRIQPFIAKYGVDPSEFAEPPDYFSSFDDFFSRRLRPEVRPIDSDASTVVFPADGRHLGLQDFTATDSLYVKGQHVNFRKLLGDGDLERTFNRGSVVISRLCPVDYHRFHFPAGGVYHRRRSIDGPLFSVNPIALRRHIAYLWENKHVVSVIETPQFGLVGMIEIGATCVGTIEYTAAPGAVEKGAEKGFFRFGGSSVVTIFEPGRVVLASDLTEQTIAGIELYARMGDVMARAAP